MGRLAQLEALMLERAESLADGRWPEILARAGVHPSYFSGRHGPCPFCPDGGGTDRYRWSNKYGGVYVCNTCTNGGFKNGFDFLIRHMGFTNFREAADYVRDYFGITGSPNDLAVVQRLAQQPRSCFKADPAKSLARMQKQWAETYAVVEGDPVHRYLSRRVPSLSVVPSEIRLHPALDYWNPPAAPGGRPTLVGSFPAMLVRGFNARDEWVQLHKTYLTSDGHKAPVANVKKTDQGVGSNSYAFRIGVPGDSLGVAEGIETEDVIEKLHLLGCSKGQGWHFGKPDQY